MHGPYQTVLGGGVGVSGLVKVRLVLRGLPKEGGVQSD